LAIFELSLAIFKEFYLATLTKTRWRKSTNEDWLRKCFAPDGAADLPDVINLKSLQLTRTDPQGDPKLQLYKTIRSILKETTTTIWRWPGLTRLRSTAAAMTGIPDNAICGTGTTVISGKPS
jgi:hypothetical protein